MTLRLRLALLAMKWGSRHSRFHSQECYTAEFVMPPDGEVSVATRREFEDGPGFFRRFEGRFVARDLEGKEVLDLGCGHGGRTAHYLIAGNPKLIVGLEISHERVHVAAHSARQLCDDDRMSFVAGYGESLPFADCSADIVLSYDVFEHVRDLPAVLSECHRVLRPGGRLYALFPPYYGPRAHHLDFVTTLPFLHHVFPPGVLVEAANSVLEERPWLRDEPLPAPARSYQGREALPRLNGTTERDFLRIISGLGFKQVEIRLLPFAWEPGGRAKAAVRLFCRAMLGLPWPFTRDVFASTIRCVLEKHQ